MRNSARQRASVFDGTLDPSAGFTLLEIVIVATILTLGACGLVSVVVNAMTVNTTNQETTEGAHAGMQLLERIRGLSAADVYATFNSDDSDDPLGVGTAPGSTIVLRGSGDPDGPGVIVGEVHFPMVSGQLREDVADPLLGTPMDLNGDGAIDSADHSGDYVLLPVRVRVRWRGVTGLRTVDICTVLLRE